jgi:amino acid permease
LPQILNGLFILSAWSCGSADTYVSTRLLFYLSRRGHAPRIFGTLLSRNVPSSGPGSSGKTMPFVIPAVPLLIAAIVSTMAYMVTQNASTASFTPVGKNGSRLHDFPGFSLVIQHDKRSLYHFMAGHDDHIS